MSEKICGIYYIENIINKHKYMENLLIYIEDGILIIHT